jgi:hypothetical protein
MKGFILALALLSSCSYVKVDEERYSSYNQGCLDASKIIFVGLTGEWSLDMATMTAQMCSKMSQEKFSGNE